MSIVVNGVELTEVIYAGVNLDIVKVKKGTAEAVTVFENQTGYSVTFNDSMQWNTYASSLDARQYSLDGGSTWEDIPNNLPFTIENAKTIMLKLSTGFGVDLQPKASCSAIGLDTGYVSSLTITQDYNLSSNVTIDLAVLLND